MTPEVSRFTITGKREADIRFMLLTYNAPGGKEIWAAMSKAERAAEEAEYRDLMQSMREEGIFLAADEVGHYDAAQTVRVRDGILRVSDRSCGQRRQVPHWLLPDRGGVVPSRHRLGRTRS